MVELELAAEEAKKKKKKRVGLGWGGCFNFYSVYGSKHKTGKKENKNKKQK